MRGRSAPKKCHKKDSFAQRLSAKTEVEGMEAISFVRNFRNGYGWETTSITEEESNTLQEQPRKMNNQIYEECVRDAHEMLKRFIVAYSNPMLQIQQTADRLFEKRAIHSLTAYQEFLKAKVQMLRNGNYGDRNGQVINGNNINGAGHYE
jgi:hypothetical protein